MLHTLRRQIKYSDAQGKADTVTFIHETRSTVASAGAANVGNPASQTGFSGPGQQSYYELMYFSAGARDIRINNDVFCGGGGDVILSRPGDFRSGRDHTSHLDRYFLRFGRDALAAMGARGQALMRFLADRNITLLHISGEENIRLRTLFADIEKRLRFSDTGGVEEMEAFADVIQILCLLTRAARTPSEQSVPTETLIRILSFIDANYTTISSENVICREFGLSRSGLWRLFKTHLKETPGAYIRKVRLEQARYMLENGAGVTYVCTETGFSDCSHFIRLFRSTYGITPYQYKKNHISKSDGPSEQ